MTKQSRRKSALPDYCIARCFDRYKDLDAAIGALKFVVPWHGSGYVNFQATPKTSKTGTVHPSFLSLHENAYPGGGIFLKDCLVLLEAESLETLCARSIDLRPRGTGWKFGWEADGPMVNGCLTFICSSFAWFCVLEQQCMPETLRQLLGCIRVSYNQHAHEQNRLVLHLVSSAAARFANRSVTDPVYLSAELTRMKIPSSQVKAVVKIYRTRTLATPKLQMPQKVEDVCIRLMTSEKICIQARSLLADIVAEHEWEKGPFTISMLMSKYLCIASPLTESCHDVWSANSLQSAAGQQLALKTYREIFESSPVRLDDSTWDSMLIACGYWTMIKDKCVPSLMLNQQVVSSFEAEIQQNKDIREELAELSCKEPRVRCQPLATWLLGWFRQCQH